MPFGIALMHLRGPLLRLAAPESVRFRSPAVGKYGTPALSLADYPLLKAPQVRIRRAGGAASVLRCGIHRPGDALGDLIDCALEFAADHHLHHHVQFRVQYQTEPGVRVRYLMELDPEREIHRDTVAHDLHVLRSDLFVHAQLHREAFGLERAGVRIGLPRFDPVGDGGREVVEAADERINLLRGPQDPVLFGDVFLHVVWFCGAKITQAPRKCKTAHESDGAKEAAAGRCRMPVVLGRGVGFVAADGRLLACLP